MTTDIEARASVRALQKAGVDFIKVHRALGREAYFAIADECARVGIPFAGHVPQAISPQQASRAHQASIEHVETLFDSNFRMDAAADLFAQFDRDGTWITPTLIAFQSDTNLAELTLSPSNGFADSRSRYVAKSVKDRTAEQMQREGPSITREWIAERKRQFEDFLKLAGLMGKDQVRILAGTDLASSVVYPGFSLHDELGLLVDGGLTPMQALQSATKSPAAFLKLPEYGTVEVGKVADIVLLDADPLEDIRNTQKIRSVFFGGNHYGRESLDGLLADSARQALNS